MYSLPAAAEDVATTRATARVVPGVISLDGQWRLAIDPKNVGRKQKWYLSAQSGAKLTKVPWIIQDAFPGYHGAAWYWRDFKAPVNRHAGGRYLLRFWAVDYMAEVWVNSKRVGGHEGGEGVFVLDVTNAIKPNSKNLLAVRVLNPDHARIDGIVLNETPRRCKVMPYRAGAAYNHGGITGPVELLVTPAIRVEDMFVRPDVKTGIIRIQANIRSAVGGSAGGQIEFTVAPAVSGEMLSRVVLRRKLKAGDTLVETKLRVHNPHLWDLNDPFLYRITARVTADSKSSVDEYSVRCGFRDFRFEKGYFRLNGRRIFLRSTHTCNHYPIGLQFAHDPDLERRDMLNAKVMGFNMVRFIWGGAKRSQLDLADEIGLMVYNESYAGFPMADSPRLAERWERSISELIRRDRNHPSVVIWGLLNEVRDTPHFRLAAASLPLVRKLDPTRMVFLNSGRWDSSGGNWRDAGDKLFSKLDIWRSGAGREPWAARNPSDQSVQTPFNFTWPPRQVALHPGPRGQYSVVRWTAPAADRCSIAATFTGLFKATTDVHLLHNGRPQFAAQLNIGGSGNTATHTSKLALAKGDTIDFVVGWGNGKYGSDSTALTAAIQSGTGRVFDLAADFPREKNPAGPWSCGWLAPAEKPNAATFALYTESKVELRPRTGTLANPGSTKWEDILADQHKYPRVPHTAATIQGLRNLTGENLPLFLSEYGIGSAVDLWRTVRHFERLGKESLEDGRFYNTQLRRYLADYKRWRLEDCFGRPVDFFAESLKKMAQERTRGLNAIRANPHLVGYNLTGMIDHVMTGEGLTTPFRELKPGTIDAMFDGWAPLRLCLFAEPVNVYRGDTVTFDAVLANEDALAPGEYPIRLQVVGPGCKRVFDRTVTVRISDRNARPEPDFAMPVLSEKLRVDGPSGKYRFLATFKKGAAAAGGETVFYVADAADMPAVEKEVVLWGQDAGLSKWLSDHGIRRRPFSSKRQSAREVILIGNRAASGGAESWRELVRHVARGSTAVFLSHGVFAGKRRPFAWLPLVNKGAPITIRGWLYLKDEWAKRHPIFEGLPAGGLMDYTYYREIIPDIVLSGQDPPAEAVAGAIKASQGYASGLTVSVYKLGKGRFILNTLRIRGNLGRHPAAERLLRNMLRYAARDVKKPPADLPPDFDKQLKALGYK